LKSSRQLSPGDAKIKSWHDGRVVENVNVTGMNAYVSAYEIKSGYDGKGGGKENDEFSSRMKRKLTSFRHAKT
jgi:hypothetical protein